MTFSALFCTLAATTSSITAFIILSICGAAIPFLRSWHDSVISPWRKSKQEARNRLSSLASVGALYEEINRSRSGWGDYAFDLDAEARFSLARDRAIEIHRRLRGRSAHLDGCTACNLQPKQGASWAEIEQISETTVRQLRSAGYWCSQGIGCVNTDLLDPAWTATVQIHEVDDPTAANERRGARTVVLLSEFEHLRRRKGAPSAAATVVSISTRT